MELVNIFLPVLFLNKITISTNFLAFFQFSSNFSLLVPDPHIECRSGSGSRRENECGSGSTALAMGCRFFQISGQSEGRKQDIWVIFSPLTKFAREKSKIHCHILEKNKKNLFITNSWKLALPVV